MTNAEKIREMTDEELAEYMPSGDCFCCPILEDYKGESCYECALHWLKSEVEE